MNWRALKVDAKCSSEVLRNFSVKLCSDHRLIHVKNDCLFLRLLPELERLIEQLLLIIIIVVILMLLSKLIAEFEEVDEFQVDQFRRVLLGHHRVASGSFPIPSLELVVEFRVKLAAADALVVEVLADACTIFLRAADLAAEVPLQLFELRLEHLAHVSGTFSHLKLYAIFSENLLTVLDVYETAAALVR